MSDAPPKFVTEGGIRRINPLFKEWKKNQGSSSSSPASKYAVSNSNANALPVICNAEQLKEMGADATVDASYDQAVEKYKSTAAKIGLNAETAMQDINTVFASLEIPQTMLSKLYLMSEFDGIAYLLDDSGSMSCSTSSGTRFSEMRDSVKKMQEMIAYVPTGPQEIHWMNSSTVTTIERIDGEKPQDFIKRAHSLIDPAFDSVWKSLGSTPVLGPLSRMFEKYKDKNIMYFLYSDGVPNEAVSSIAQLISNRKNPEKNPFMFRPCTDNDDDVEWMSIVEEKAKACSSIDDYESERAECLHDQGIAFPYSYGLYLVASLVSATFECRDSLDAMDESSPIVKTTFSSFVGYNVTDAEFDYYLDEFFKANLKKTPRSNEDYLKYHYAKKFSEIRDQFHKASTAEEIPLVKEYKEKMLTAETSGREIRAEVDRIAREEREKIQRRERADNAVRECPDDEQRQRGAIEREMMKFFESQETERRNRIANADNAVRDFPSNEGSARRSIENDEEYDRRRILSEMKKTKSSCCVIA